jgi:SAM-dependent methyltransferase
MRIFHRLLEQPFLFNLSQLPFTKQKFARILKYNDLNAVRAVLDIGCGPGTNAQRFANAKYLGIDINHRYIELARTRHHRDFLVADVTTSEAIPAGTYDFILVNSFLHHIQTDDARRVLARAAGFLAADGHLHSIELVLPQKAGVSRWLALHDRGEFPRSLQAWREIFEDKLYTVIFEPFPVRHLGQTIMELVYFKGRKKQ